MGSVVPLYGHNLDLNGITLYQPSKITDRRVLNSVNIKAILSFGTAVGSDNWQVIKEKYKVSLNNDVSMTFDCFCCIIVP